MPWNDVPIQVGDQIEGRNGTTYGASIAVVSNFNPPHGVWSGRTPNLLIRRKKDPTRESPL